MTYDPELDEPIYSRRELNEAVDLVFDRGFRTGMEMTLASFANTPLQIFGRWEQGRVYDVASLVFHNGGQWVSTIQTASAPNHDNAAWRHVDFPRIKDPSTNRGTESI